MKVIIVGTPFFGYTKLIEKAFKKRSGRIDTFIFPRMIGFYLKVPLIKKLYKALLKQKNNGIFNSVLSTIEKDNTVLLLFGVNYFSPKQLKSIKTKGAKIICYFIDSIYAYDLFFQAIPFSDLIITYNKEDYIALQKNNSVFLPLMYDPDQYYKIDTIEKDIDLYFIGSINERKNLLNKVCESLDSLNLKIIIDGSLKKDKISKTKFPFLYKYYRGYVLNAKEINEMYNRTKLCLNLQPRQATSSLNIRTFEIYGSENQQITIANPEIISEVFKNHMSIINCENIIDLVEKLKIFYKNDETNSMSFTKLNHTYDDRIDKLIELIKI